MGLDPFDLLLSIVIFFIYGSICIISLIFTFSLETYKKIDEALNLEIFFWRPINLLDINIDYFDQWLIRHHRIIGPILVILSLLDLKLSFEIILKF